MEPEIKIRGYHTDFYNHVNNARYLEFFEEGRWQLFEDYLPPEVFTQGKYSFFVVNINLSYMGQAKINDIIVVKSGMLKFGNKSAAFRQQIVKKDSNEIIAQADVTFVVADKSGKALIIEDEIKKMLLNIPPFEN
ncbi:MAG: acyl-CoA thioesterase [Desulfobacteraceae bacterium]|nr:acyl-CoA thioesterase [Desulfobacteraceae bacterium]